MGLTGGGGGDDDRPPRATRLGDVADDGAVRGSFNRRCERCNQLPEGGQLVWLWRDRKFYCTICAVRAAYDDALKTIIASMNEAPRKYGPFEGASVADELRTAAVKIQEQAREQLEGPRDKSIPR